MSLCQFTRRDDLIECQVCGRRPVVHDPKLPAERYHAKCSTTFRKVYDPIATSAKEPAAKVGRTDSKTKLGDRFEQALSSIGVTEDWYKDVKERFGLPPTCGCSKRKEWLNNVSDWWESVSA